MLCTWPAVMLERRPSSEESSCSECEAEAGVFALCSFESNSTKCTPRMGFAIFEAFLDLHSAGVSSSAICCFVSGAGAALRVSGLKLKDRSLRIDRCSSFLVSSSVATFKEELCESFRTGFCSSFLAPSRPSTPKEELRELCRIGLRSSFFEPSPTSTLKEELRESFRIGLRSCFLASSPTSTFKDELGGSFCGGKCDDDDAEKSMTNYGLPIANLPPRGGA